MNKLIVVVLLSLLGGCESDSYGKGLIAKNNRNLFKLELGSSREHVLSIMGEPMLHEAYASLGGEKVEIWFYYTHRTDDGELYGRVYAQGDTNYTKDEMTPVILRSGRLVGWGDEFYESKEIIEIRRR